MDAEVSPRSAPSTANATQRVTYRIGYRSRTWDTRVGTMGLHIPKLREGSYFPSLLEPRKPQRGHELTINGEAGIAGIAQ